MSESLAKGFVSSVTVDIKPDHTFQMTMVFPLEGNWSVSGNQLTLNFTKVMGMDATKSGGSQKPAVFTISPDGNTLVPQEQGKSSFDFVLQKTPS